MERDNVEEFLKKMGKDSQEPSQWDRVIQPNSSYLIVGDVGTGKSALAYYLLEEFGKKYELLSAVVGFPRDKQHLLPGDWVVLDEPSECTKHENIIVFIDEADLQLPIEDSKAREYVVNFLSLPRHRKQIFLLAFHFPRLVLGRYLPFFSGFLLKRPPYLIEFAGKRQNDALTQMMERAEERFAELTSEEEVRKNTYVVAPRIRWQGMLENPLCSFWSHGLSEVWAGTEVEPPQPKPKQTADDIFFPLFPNEVNKGWLKSDETRKAVFPVAMEMKRRAKEVERNSYQKHGWVTKEDPVTGVRWLEQAY